MVKVNEVFLMYTCIYLIICHLIYQVLAILYDGGEAAQQEPRLLGTTENKVGFPICKGKQDSNMLQLVARHQRVA